MSFRKAFLIGFILVSVSNNWAAEYTAKNGAVVSRSTLASQAGREILLQGGNAIDAAVATGFALAVTYPSAGNLGGGGFAVIRTADGNTFALDFRETAPKNLKPGDFLDETGQVISSKLTLHPLGCGVPGTVDGLILMHERFGTLPLKALIQPAIDLAEKGFDLPASMVSAFKEQMEFMQDYPASKELFSSKGESFPVGFRWVQKDLAKTLKRIQKKGRAGFYQGKTADLLINEIQRTGGVMTFQDLLDYKSKWREPVAGTFRGYQVISMPPPSSGGALLIQILNMMENLEPREWCDVDQIHYLIEAERLAYADRAVHLGDPDFHDNPLLQLVSKAYAKERFNLISEQKANLSDEVQHGQFPEESHETTHFSVLDKWGNAVSLTTTLNWSYGNKRIVPGAGFLMNNEIDDFSVKEGVPNSYGLLGNKKNLVQGGKRMLSSMTPTILLGPDGDLVVLGSPGGSTIITTVLQVVVNLIDHHMTLEQAVMAPRFHHQWKPDRVLFERLGWFPTLIESLKNKGHRNLIKMDDTLGDVNAIRLKGGSIHAVTDPRFDALPAVY